MIPTYRYREDDETYDVPKEDLINIMTVCDQFIDEGRRDQIIDHLCERPDILAPRPTIVGIVEDYMNDFLRRDML